MARRRKSFINKGTQFGAVDDQLTAQEMDNAIFPNTTQNTEDDPLLSQLASRPFRRALHAAGGKIVRGNFTLTMTGLTYNGDEPTVDEWREMGEWLNQLRDSIQWMIGDWANMGVEYMTDWLDPADLAVIESGTVGDVPEGKYKWLAALVDYSYGTLRNFAYVARLFPVSRRHDTLTYSHHVEVAGLPDVKQQDKLLKLASKGQGGKRLSVRELRELIKGEQGQLISSGPIVEKTRTAPLILNVVRIQHELTADQWKALTREERRRAYDDLKAALQKMEQLGLD